MTEREYVRLSRRIAAVVGEPVSIGSPHLPQESFDRIWQRISAGEQKAEDFEDLMAAATRAKRRLLAYVEEEGPFVFDRDRCLFIDVAAFDLDDWQWMRIPVREVTYAAQKAFLTEYERDPRAYLYAHRHELVIFAIAAIALIIYLVR